MGTHGFHGSVRFCFKWSHFRDPLSLCFGEPTNLQGFMSHSFQQSFFSKTGSVSPGVHRWLSGKIRIPGFRMEMEFTPIVRLLPFRLQGHLRAYLVESAYSVCGPPTHEVSPSKYLPEPQLTRSWNSETGLRPVIGVMNSITKMLNVAVAWRFPGPTQELQNRLYAGKLATTARKGHRGVPCSQRGGALAPAVGSCFSRKEVTSLPRCYGS